MVLAIKVVDEGTNHDVLYFAAHRALQYFAGVTSLHNYTEVRESIQFQNSCEIIVMGTGDCDILQDISISHENYLKLINHNYKWRIEKGHQGRLPLSAKISSFSRSFQEKLVK